VRARASPCLLWIAVAIVGAAAAAWCEDLATGQLEIRGAVLKVSPARQEVAPGLPTVVLTALGQLDPSQIPAGLRVEGDLSGPGLAEPLRLTTTPGDAFRIPGLNREGTYTLSSIRLIEGERTISAADPDSVEILVHRLVISTITSRALTPEEMGDQLQGDDLGRELARLWSGYLDPGSSLGTGVADGDVDFFDPWG